MTFVDTHSGGPINIESREKHIGMVLTKNQYLSQHTYKRDGIVCVVGSAKKGFESIKKSFSVFKIKKFPDLQKNKFKLMHETCS